VGRPALVVDAVLFDCDGVLVDVNAAVEARWRAFARENGIDADMVAARAHGRRAVDHVAAVAPELDAEAEAARIEEGEIEDAVGATAHRGAVAAFSAVPYGRRAVVSSSGPRLLRRRLRAAGIPPAPVLIDGAADLPGKPRPDPYLRAACELGVRPERCLVVEDAVDGVRAGRAAGAAVIGVGPNARALAAAGTLATVDDLRGVQFRPAEPAGAVAVVLTEATASSTSARLPM
jgi:sugar-phosphatase